jgi:hypothetical protein
MTQLLVLWAIFAIGGRYAIFLTLNALPHVHITVFDVLLTFVSSAGAIGLTLVTAAGMLVVTLIYGHFHHKLVCNEEHISSFAVILLGGAWSIIFIALAIYTRVDNIVNAFKVPDIGANLLLYGVGSAMTLTFLFYEMWKNNK